MGGVPRRRGSRSGIPLGRSLRPRPRELERGGREHGHRPRRAAGERRGDGVRRERSGDPLRRGRKRAFSIIAAAAAAPSRSRLHLAGQRPQRGQRVVVERHVDPDHGQRHQEGEVGAAPEAAPPLAGEHRAEHGRGRERRGGGSRRGRGGSRSCCCCCSCCCYSCSCCCSCKGRGSERRGCLHAGLFFFFFPQTEEEGRLSEGAPQRKKKKLMGIERKKNIVSSSSRSP